jgi:hypothetical protein
MFYFDNSESVEFIKIREMKNKNSALFNTTEMINLQLEEERKMEKKRKKGKKSGEKREGR